MELKPFAVAVIERATVSLANILRSYELDIPEDLTVQELLELGLIEWGEKFDRLGEALEGAELITVYADGPLMTEYEDEGGLLKTMRTSWDGESPMYYINLGGGDSIYYKSQISLTGLLLMNGYTINSRFGTFTFLAGVRANPLLIAMNFLRYVYIATLAAALVGFWLVRRGIRQKLIEPLIGINSDMADGLKLPAITVSTFFLQSENLTVIS